MLTADTSSTCSAAFGPVASDIVVSLPGLEPQRGVVRWNEGGQIGITFNRLLPLSDLVGWLQAQRDGIRAAS